MRVFLFAGTILAAVAPLSFARASDLPARLNAPPPVPAELSPRQPETNWDGYYVGGYVGYGKTIDDRIGIRQYPSWILHDIGGNLRPGGVLGGLAVGRNFRMGDIVYGVESSATLLTGSQTHTGVYPAPVSTTVTTRAAKDWTASLRGRLGYVMGDRLYYATGGLATTHVKYKLSPQGGTSVNTANIRVGAVVGMGVEQAFTPNWVGRVEALYTLTGRHPIGPAACCGGSLETLETQKHWQIRMGVNYVFGNSPSQSPASASPPLSTKY